MAVLAVWTVGRPGEPEAPTYDATLSITALETGGDTGGGGGGRTDDNGIGFYAFIAAETPEISDRVAEQVGERIFPPPLTTSEAILDSLTIEELTEISTMTLTFENLPDEDVASEIVEGFGAELVTYAQARYDEEYEAELSSLVLQERELRATIDKLTTELEALAEEQTDEEKQARTSPDVTKEAERTVALESLGQVITDADTLRNLTPEERVPLQVSGSPSIVANEVSAEPLGFGTRLALATVLGALLGIGLTFALHRFDTRLFNRKDTETAYNLPVLAEVPRLRWWRRRRNNVITQSDPRARASEAYRLLRSSVARIHRLRVLPGHDRAPEHGMVILVASASASVGKSSTVANLAVASVDAGKSVLVIGGDLRQPTIERFFDVGPGVGLTDCVDEVERVGLDNLVLDRYLVPTATAGITLMRSGHAVPNPGERLAAARPVVEYLRQGFDMVIIDSPPMLAGNDVSEVVPYVDVMLLVARIGSTTIEEAQWSRETAERMEAPVCGVALVGVTNRLRGRAGYGPRFPALARLMSKLRPSPRSEITVPTSPPSPEDAQPGVPALDSFPPPSGPMSNGTVSRPGSPFSGTDAPPTVTVPDISDILARQGPEGASGPAPTSPPATPPPATPSPSATPGPTVAVEAEPTPEPTPPNGTVAPALDLDLELFDEDEVTDDLGAAWRPRGTNGTNGSHSG